MQINYVPMAAALTLLVGTGCTPTANPLNRYYIPQDYVGRVRIQYDVPGAPSLESAEGRYRILRIPQSGTVETSSPAFYGAELTDCSGELGRQYRYVDDQGTILRSLLDSSCDNPEIHGKSTGADHTEYFFVGTQAEVDRIDTHSCFGGQRQADGSITFPEYDEPQEFYLPDQYVGWVKIAYAPRSPSPKLPTAPVSRALVHNIPTSGKLRTSSEHVLISTVDCHKNLHFFYDASLSEKGSKAAPPESLKENSQVLMEETAKDSALAKKKLVAEEMIWDLRSLVLDHTYHLIFFVGTQAEFQEYSHHTNLEDFKFGGERMDDGTVIFPTITGDL